MTPKKPSLFRWPLCWRSTCQREAAEAGRLAAENFAREREQLERHLRDALELINRSQLEAQTAVARAAQAERERIQIAAPAVEILRRLSRISVADIAGRPTHRFVITIDLADEAVAPFSGHSGALAFCLSQTMTAAAAMLQDHERAARKEAAP